MEVLTGNGRTGDDMQIPSMAAIQTESRSDLARQIWLFLVLVFGLSILPYILLLAADEASVRRHYIIALMWTPGVAAMLALRICGLGLSSLGWNWGEWRWNWYGYLLPAGYVCVAYMMIWILGAGTFTGEAELKAVARALDWDVVDPLLLVAGFVLVKAGPGIIIGLSSAIGEEIGWRGFLVPRMVELGGFMPAALATGVIWAMWHFPLLLLGGYNNGTEWWVGLACFSLLVVNASVILTWLRMRSDSLWPCAIFHASHNLFIQAVFNPLTGDVDNITAYFTGEFGFAVPGVMTLVALLIWRTARRSNLVRPCAGADAPSQVA